MKALLIFIAMVYVVRPVKVVPYNLRECVDYIGYDQKYKMFYVDSSGTKLYYKDVTSFHMMSRWVMDCDLKVGSAAVFVGI